MPKNPVFARLERVFARECARFARRFPARRPPTLVIEGAPCVLPDACAPRDFGYMVAHGRHRRVVLHFRLAFQGPKRILGVVRHELGHAFDPDLQRPGAEQRADDIAAWVTGEKIRYDRDDVQTVGRGRYPRPENLPK